jgi:hypothetical protein
MARIDQTTGDLPKPLPKTAPVAPKQEAAASKLGGDALTLSTGQKLLEGNRRALKVAGSTLRDLVVHPLRTLGAMATGTFDLIANPHRIQEGLRAAFQRSPVDGAIHGVMLSASIAGVAALMTMGVAYGAALFTGGASLAILPAAGVAASWAGAIGVGALGASFIKNQVDVAGAKTEGSLAQQSQELGQDMASLGLAGATSAVSHGLGAAARKLKPKNVNPSAAQRAAYRVQHQVKDKVVDPAPAMPAANRGIKIDGKTRDHFRQRATQEVSEAMKDSVQGKRPLKVEDLDMGSFEGVDRLGEHRMVFHGTRSEISPLIRQNGLQVSDIGDYGSGLYFGGSAKIGVNYADDVTIGRSASATNRPAVYVAEMAPGKVLDYVSQKDTFLAWAKARFDPTDLSDPLNKLYHDPSVPVSKMVDNTWTRYLPQYCKEMGYDSILIRDWDGPGLDYWVVHDPKRVVLRQEIVVDAPENKFLVPPGFNGQNAVTLQATEKRAREHKAK